jgi:hypothetical protein
MQNLQKKKKWFGWAVAAFLVWLVMNIRVAAGISSTFERAVDGLVGIMLLLAVVFLALDYFQVIGKGKE